MLSVNLGDKILVLARLWTVERVTDALVVGRHASGDTINVDGRELVQVDDGIWLLPDGPSAPATAFAPPPAIAVLTAISPTVE